MSPHNDEDSSRRLHILSVNEVAALYGLPEFTAEDQVHFFSLSADERAVLPQWHTCASRIFFILQLGYFKAVQQFFVFKLAEVIQDVTWIQQTHFPDCKLPTSTVAKGTRLKHQAIILHLRDYRLCGDLERQQLASKAEQVVRISSKPVFVLHEMLHFLANQRIVAPGYTVLQDIVSNAQYEYRKPQTAGVGAPREAARSGLDWGESACFHASGFSCLWEIGHGANVVDTTLRPIPGSSYAFWYFTRVVLEEGDDVISIDRSESTSL